MARVRSMEGGVGERVRIGAPYKHERQGREKDTGRDRLDSCLTSSKWTILNRDLQ